MYCPMISTGQSLLRELWRAVSNSFSLVLITSSSCIAGIRLCCEYGTACCEVLKRIVGVGTQPQSIYHIREYYLDV